MVRLLDYIQPRYIIKELRATNRDELLRELSLPLVSDLPALLQERVVEALKKREELQSTAVGGGVAIPHGKVPDFPEIRIGVGIHPRGAEFFAVDRKPVNLFFLLLASDRDTGLYLNLLGRIARIIRSQEIRTRLSSARTREEILAILEEVENAAVLPL